MGECCRDGLSPTGPEPWSSRNSGGHPFSGGGHCTSPTLRPAWGLVPGSRQTPHANSRARAVGVLGLAAAIGRQSPRVGLRVDWSTASSGKGPSLGVLWVRCFRAGKVDMGDSGGGPALRPPSSTYRHRAWEGTPWGAATSRPLVQPLPCASQIKPSPSLLDTTHHCSTPVKASDTWAFPPGVREGLVLGEYGEGGSTSEGTWDGLWP